MNYIKIIFLIIILTQGNICISQQLNKNIYSCCDFRNEFKPNLNIKKKHISISEKYSTFFNHKKDSILLEELKRYDTLGRVIEYKYRDEFIDKFYIQKNNWTSDSTIEIKIIFENNSDSIINFRRRHEDGSGYSIPERLSFDTEGHYYYKKYKLLLNNDYSIYKVEEYDFNSKLMKENIHPLSTRKENDSTEIITKDSIVRNGKLEMFHIKSKNKCTSIKDTSSCKNQNENYTYFFYDHKNRLIKKESLFSENFKRTSSNYFFYNYDNKNRIIEIKSNTDNSSNFYRIYKYYYRSKHKLKKITFDIDPDDSIINERYIFKRKKKTYYYSEKFDKSSKTWKTYYTDNLPYKIEYFNGNELMKYYQYYIYK